MMKSRYTIPLLLALALGACGDSSGPPKAGPPATLTVVSGATLQGQAGEPLATPLSVKVTDKSDRPVANAPVNFSIISGGGSLSASVDSTDAAGVASVIWTVGPSIGEGRAQATVTGVAVPALFNVTITAGPPADIARLPGQIGKVAAGFDLGDSIAIKITDRFLQPVAGVPVTFSVTAGGGAVLPASKTTGDDGIARTSWKIGTAGSQTLRAQAGTLETTFSGTAIDCPETTLAVGQAITVAPTAAQCLVMTGSAQRYVVAVTNPSTAPTSIAAYRVRGAGASTATSTTSAAPSIVATAGGLSSAAAAILTESRAAARAHDRALRASYAVMERLGSPATAGARSSLSASVVSAAAVPNVGDILSLKIPKNLSNNLCDNSESTSPDIGAAHIAGRVVYVGPHSIMVEDTLDPLHGQFDALYQSIGQEFDNVMWPILTANYGNPLAMDARLNNTDHVFMIFSNVINKVLNGQLAGFVSSGDFYPTTSCAASNMQPTFYARVPTSTATGFDQDNTTQTPDEWYRAMRTVVIHETKHVTSFAEKISRNPSGYSFPIGFFSRDQWLEESSAMLAEELWARTIFNYAQFGNVGYGASLYCEVRPRPDARWPQCQPTKPTSLIDHYVYLYDYAEDPENLSIVGPVKSGDFTFYGSGWLFLRWVIDQYAASEPTFLNALTTDYSNAGVDNIVLRTGKSFGELLADFAIAFALDDYPAFTAANSKHAMPSWNTRDIFANLSADFPGTFTNPAPVRLRPVSFGQFAIDVFSVHGGGISFVQVSGTQSSKQLLEFQGASGTDFPVQMRITVVRVQ